MKRSILNLEASVWNDLPYSYRALIKTKHGRQIYIELSLNNGTYTITECFYTDRNQGRTGERRYSAKPLRLHTLKFPVDRLLSIVETELDRKFYGVEFTHDGNAGLPIEEYIRVKQSDGREKYHFLIMVGEGESHDGLPVLLRTRLKNRLHRAVYIELEYCGNGRGVVKRCFYYDRRYKCRYAMVTPPSLISCFFPYNREGIINMINNEICCNFTHIIVAEGIDIDSNTEPLCGAL